MMLQRLADDTIDDNDEGGAGGKFTKDMIQMMDGILDLQRRGQLPDREKSTCTKLLLRITLREDSFTVEQREQAQTWLTILEGTRNRRVRTEVKEAVESKVPPMQSAARRRGAKSKKDEPVSNVSGSSLATDPRDKAAKSRRRNKTVDSPSDELEAEDNDRLSNDGNDDDFVSNLARPKRYSGRGSRGDAGAYFRNKDDGVSESTDLEKFKNKHRMPARGQGFRLGLISSSLPLLGNVISPDIDDQVDDEAEIEQESSDIMKRERVRFV